MEVTAKVCGYLTLPAMGSAGAHVNVQISRAGASMFQTNITIACPPQLQKRKQFCRYLGVHIVYKTCHELITMAL